MCKRAISLILLFSLYTLQGKRGNYTKKSEGSYSYNMSYLD